MEEQQIQTFVHAVLQDEQLRKEFVSDPDTVIMREGFSPRLSSVLRKLVPCLEVSQALPNGQGTGQYIMWF